MNRTISDPIYGIRTLKDDEYTWEEIQEALLKQEWGINLKKEDLEKLKKDLNNEN
jgi:hypothetical protein